MYEPTPISVNDALNIIVGMLSSSGLIQVVVACVVLSIFLSVVVGCFKNVLDDASWSRPYVHSEQPVEIRANSIREFDSMVNDMVKLDINEDVRFYLDKLRAGLVKLVEFEGDGSIDQSGIISTVRELNEKMRQEQVARVLLSTRRSVVELQEQAQIIEDRLLVLKGVNSNE